MIDASSEQNPVINGMAPVGRRRQALLELAVVFSTPFVLIALASVIAGRGSSLQQPAVIVAALAMVGLIIVFQRRRSQRCADLGLTLGAMSLRSSLRVIAMSVVTFALAAGAFIGAGMAIAALQPEPATIEETGLEFLQGNLPALLATLTVVYLTASFSEEFIYRGFLMHRVAEIGGGGRGAWIVAALVSAFLFGLAHYSWGFAGMVQTACMGLALAACYVAFGRRLWVVILAHGCMDTILLVEVYLSAPTPS